VSRVLLGLLVKAFVPDGPLVVGIDETLERRPSKKIAYTRASTDRTTPALLGLFSLVTLFAHQQMRQAVGALRRQAAWYHKAHPTFADALGLVRKELWAQEQTFYGSPADTETVKVPRAYVERLTDAVCYAA
jgi:hypothetical protein